jgi:2,4-dienoyl-CoA reductase (NADPH2)
MDYEVAIKNRSTIKDRVAIIGAGGIGFDVAEMLVADGESNQDWYEKWKIDKTYQHRGGVMSEAEDSESEIINSVAGSGRVVYLLQRKDEKPGINLARTTGWIRRLSLRRAGVKMMPGVTYNKIDDYGLHISNQDGNTTLAVDHVIICAGQESENSLYQQLKAIGQPAHIIGGAKKSAELDAETAIREGLELAYSF